LRQYMHSATKMKKIHTVMGVGRCWERWGLMRMIGVILVCGARQAYSTLLGAKRPSTTAAAGYLVVRDWVGAWVYTPVCHSF
jgi:hypothetical protein